MEVGFISAKGQWRHTLADGIQVTDTYARSLSGLVSAKARIRGSNVLLLRNNTRVTMGHREVEALFKSELIQIPCEQHENGGFATLLGAGTANLFESSGIASGS
jgi:hypothetical protein